MADEFESITEAVLDELRVNPEPDYLIELISDELDIQNPGWVGRIRDGIEAYREGCDG